jgi:hypothetical protein
MKKTSKKSKYDLVKLELKLEHSSWYDYYDDYYDYDAYHNGYYDYSYLPKETQHDMLSGPIFRRRESSNQYFPYNIVDMNSIYSKQTRRNKFIDELLGITNSQVTYKPTFADIINKNK